ncbi:unnamed protein product [Trichobilharzia regenti]|nr:unnamed protein product [Trichobilharzia regenti]
MNCHPTTWRDNTTINPSNHPIDLHETPKRRCGDSSWDWSNLEDCKLLDHVSRHGESRWQLIGKRLGKPALQCSER